MNISEKIRHLMYLNCINSTELSVGTNLEKEYIESILDGTKKIVDLHNIDFILLAGFLNVPYEYLYHYGVSFPLEIFRESVLNKIRSLEDHKKLEILRIISMEIKKCQTQTST